MPVSSERFPFWHTYLEIRIHSRRQSPLEEATEAWHFHPRRIQTPNSVDSTGPLGDGEEGCQIGGVSSGDDHNVDEEETDEDSRVMAARQEQEGLSEVYPWGVEAGEG